MTVSRLVATSRLKRTPWQMSKSTHCARGRNNRSAVSPFPFPNASVKMSATEPTGTAWYQRYIQKEMPIPHHFLNFGRGYGPSPSFLHSGLPHMFFLSRLVMIVITFFPTFGPPTYVFPFPPHLYGISNKTTKVTRTISRSLVKLPSMQPSCVCELWPPRSRFGSKS